MADKNPESTVDLTHDSLLSQTNVSDEWKMVQQVLAPLASLKLTVVLLLMGIFIVFIGTLAQVEKDIWEVISEYFRVSNGQFLVWVNPTLFFPPAFFPGGTPTFPSWLGIWFPKGWVIGAAMILNLMAAHFVRFKVQANGTRLLAGVLTLVLGAIATFLVIYDTSGGDGLQGVPWISYAEIWMGMSLVLLALCGVCTFAATLPGESITNRRILFGGLAVALGGGAIYGLRSEPFDADTMRILYQLLNATFVSTVLMVGSVLVFKKRGGIVLIHAGIGLMMAYEVLVGLQHVESQMRIQEGESVNFSRDIRDVELAVIDSSGKDEDLVTVVPGSRLASAARKKVKISNDLLPFEVELLSYFPNSDLRALASYRGDDKPPENPATTGIGTRFITFGASQGTGTDTSGQVDVPAGYARLTTRSGEDLGVYMLSAFPDMVPGMLDETQQVTVDGKEYSIALRYKRIYHDYWFTLNDVQKNDYKGTSNPRDYSSFVKVEHNGTSFEQRIWMNNPMRFSGSTFYQSSYIPAGAMGRGSQETTVLQVVTNHGWMTPYVACMMVVVGMFGQFGATLLRFLDRRDRSLNPIESVNATWSTGWTGQAIGAVLALLVLASIVSKAQTPSVSPGEFNVSGFGQLPMWYRGRAMPLDTFARNSLLQLADRETYRDAEGDRQPAMRWMLTLMADEDAARKLRTIRIENKDVIDSLGLESNREGLVFSMEEIGGGFESLVEQAQSASQKEAKGRTVRDKKVLELANRVVLYRFIEMTLGRPPELPNDEQFGSRDPQLRKAMFGRFLQVQREAVDEFRRENRSVGPLPLLVPAHIGLKSSSGLPLGFQTDWDTLAASWIFAQYFDETEAEQAPAIAHFCKAVKAYGDNDPETFNSEVETYSALLQKYFDQLKADQQPTAEDLPLDRTNAEARFNRMALFTNLSVFYVVSLVIAFLGWLVAPVLNQRVAFVFSLGLLAIYTYAVYMRMYISGRPPVTNLYSSAIFIGWATVAGGLIIESFTWKGIGNVIAAATGFAALRIADGLATDGDTIAVMEAVLDTQFWLATHVVCITLGYATTFLAGGMGILYLFVWVFSRKMSDEWDRTIARMLYGTLCFATFFSFFGTVLGGLWADDSWGRFWGWDPKENGALIIVLWNAVILHARWGAMIKGRGLAMLATVGNIVVAWSWFGVNELGVGLHSYGFTEGRLRWLGLFVVSQLLIAGLGWLPKHLWTGSDVVDAEESTSDEAGLAPKV